MHYKRWLKWSVVLTVSIGGQSIMVSSISCLRHFLAEVHILHFSTSTGLGICSHFQYKPYLNVTFSGNRMPSCHTEIIENQTHISSAHGYWAWNQVVVKCIPLKSGRGMSYGDWRGLLNIVVLCTTTPLPLL